jgi:hypothetical protein
MGLLKNTKRERSREATGIRSDWRRRRNNKLTVGKARIYMG